jgi:hypothetical protein
VKIPAEIAAIKDSQERARSAHLLIEEYQSAVNELSRIRRESLEDLLAEGWNQTKLAALLDMSRSRMSQLLSAGTRPEKAFLGTGKITVSIGGKKEGGKSAPGDVISTESFAAFEAIVETARAVGLDASYEVVPPPGYVELNRANLIVLTNPRLLPFLSQVMGADPHLRYLHDDSGWYITDQTEGVDYRAPDDRTEPYDFGYIGRLPRPDGKGTFLYCAGTHAPGTLAAARYLCDNLSDLYRELKARRFSTVVKCTYEPGNTRTMTSIERVAPLYHHDGA